MSKRGWSTILRNLHTHNSSDLSKQSMIWRDNQLEISKNNVANRLAAMSAATASIISLTSGDPEAFDYTAIGAGVSTM